jgi:hypothetical protein
MKKDCSSVTVLSPVALQSITYFEARSFGNGRDFDNIKCVWIQPQVSFTEKHFVKKFRAP